MTTTIYYFSGKAYWAKVYEHNLDDYGGIKSAQIEVELDGTQRKLLKESGSRTQPKLQEDGSVRVKFKRKFESPIPELGGLPKVTDAEGAPFDKLIGNGSEVTVKVSVYDTKLGKGTRLEAIRVDTLVEYEGSNDGEPKVNVNTTNLVGVPF